MGKDLVGKTLERGKKLAKETFSYQNIKNGFVNIGVTWAGFKASSVTCAFFGGELNRYNTDEHLMMGAAIGALTGGRLYGFLASTAFNFVWEILESKGNLYALGESPINTATDIAAVYAGAMVLAPLIEKGKNAVENSIKRRKQRWVV